MVEADWAVAAVLLSSHSPGLQGLGQEREVRIVKSEIDGKVKEWESTSISVGVMGGGGPLSWTASSTAVLDQFSTQSQKFWRD